MRIPLGDVSPSSSAVQAIANAIYQQEGPVQNNNPGNLVYVGQAGATGADSRGFAIFPTLQAGQQAEQAQIALDINRGSCATGSPLSTLTDLIDCLTPPSDPANNTPAYINAVAAATGIDPGTVLLSYTGGSTGDITAVDGSDGSPSTGSAGIDLTDPVTLALMAGAGLLAWFVFARS